MNNWYFVHLYRRSEIKIFLFNKEDIPGSCEWRWSAATSQRLDNRDYHCQRGRR